MNSKVPLYNIWDRLYAVEAFQPGDFVSLLYLIDSDPCTCAKKKQTTDYVADIITVFISFSTIFGPAILSVIVGHNI